MSELEPYEDLAIAIREHTHATGVVLLVIGGNRGHGSAIQILTKDQAKTRQVLAWALRQLADELEQDATPDLQPE